MLYIFAGAVRSSIKAAAALPAVAVAGKAAAALPAAAAAAPDARQALCASMPASALNPGSTTEVHDFLISNTERATEIAIVATEWQDSAAERIDAAAPASATAPEDDQDQELSSQELETPGKAKNRKPRGRKRQRSSAAADGAEAVAESQDVGPVMSPTRWNRKADAANMLVINYPVNSGSGIKLGQAITMSAFLIQGPFTKEDKADNQEHRRQVQSAMLNVYSESKIASFVEAGLKNPEDMDNYCLQRVEVARITKQRAVTALQKWLNSLFLGPLGCKAEFRGTRDLLIIIALRLSIDVWFFGAAHMGFSQDFTQDGAASILDRWKNEDGSRKYKQLCPDDSKDSRFYPCKIEDDGKAVAMLVSNFLRLDGRHPYKEGTGHDPLRAGNVPLARFGPSSPKYSELGCYMLVEFWCKSSTLGPLSRAFAFSTPTEVDIAFEKEWKM